MYVMQLTRFKGGKDAEMVKSAKAAAAIIQKHGAEFFRLQKFHSGPFVGEWLVAIRFADWTTYGKVQDALAKDADYQALFAKVLGTAELTFRAVATGVDL